MKHRIRVAAIIKKRDKILLVKHAHSEKGKVWWVPPGGGLEAKDANIFAAAVRETYEETGVRIRCEKIVYIREYLHSLTNSLNLEIFCLAQNPSGQPTIQNIRGRGGDEKYIQDVRWFTKQELQKIKVYPEELKNDFWKRNPKKGAQYLGRKGNKQPRFKRGCLF